MSDGKNVKCPGCDAEYDATGYDPGDQFQCPGCQEIVTVGGAPAGAPAPKTARMPSRGTTRRTSRPPSPPSSRGGTAKMRVVSGAVGMGATDPGLDMKAIRRGSAQAPVPQQQGPDRTMVIIGSVVGLIAIVGAIIALSRGPSAEEKKKAALEAARKKQEQKNKEEEEARAAGSGSGTSGSSGQPATNKPPTKTGWDSDPTIEAHVSQVLTLLKGKPEDAVFWKTAAPLLKYGREVIPVLVERWSGEDIQTVMASRAIVQRATKRPLPEDLFDTSIHRQEMLMVFRDWWIGEKGSLAQLVSEEDFLAGTGGGSTTPPDPGPGPGPKPPDGVGTPPKPVGGGRGDAAMRRDLPQHLANYATGTGEQRDRTMAEVRGYGKGVIPLLIQNLNNEDFGQARAANSLLAEFTKQQMGNLPAEDRGAFIKKWEDWWKANEGTFSM